MARKPGIARAAALLAMLAAVSQVLGFVRDAVIAAVYGAGSELDAYLVAQGLMNLVLALAAGAMAKSIVPPLSRSAADGDVSRSNRTLQTTLTVTVGVLLAGSVVMWLAAEQVVALMAPGFDDATSRLAQDLTRIVLISTVFVAATNLLAAAAQAHGRFFHSGVQGIPFNLVMIAAAAWFGNEYGVQALAVGFVIGSAVRCAVQLPAVRACRLRLRPRLAVRDADFREVLHLAPPILLSTAVVSVNTLVDRAVGSTQGEGTIAALSFGWRIVTLVDSLLVVTVAAALYPAFSAVGAAERRHQMRALVDRSLAVMLVLLAPVVALLVVAAEPLVSLVFGRGDFDSAAVRLTSLAVVAYAVSAAGLGLRVIVTRAFFAVGDGRTPVVLAVATMGVNVVGDLTLGVAYGVPGLAASTSVSLILGAVGLAWLLARRHAGVSLGALGGTAVRVVVAATAAGGAAAVVDASGLLPDTGQVADAGRLAVMLAVLLAVYLAALRGMRSRELQELVAVVRRRFLPKR